MFAKLREKLGGPLNRAPVVSVLRLHGAIGGGGGLRGGLNDAALATQIEQAFAPKRLKAVALSINSPGGIANAKRLDRRTHSTVGVGA